AVPLLDADAQERARQAVEQLAEGFGGPFATWFRDLADGCCRLPELSADSMAALLAAWLSPAAEGGAVCTGCGLEFPKHQHPPLTEGNPRRGRAAFDGNPPPWYDLPEFFQACPRCGGSLYGLGMTWPHLVNGEDYPWMQLDGYVGKPSQDSGE